MTKSIAFLVAVSAVLLACNSSADKTGKTTQNEKDPYVGVFVRDSTDESGTIHDTLDIKPSGLALQNGKAEGLYQVIHKTGVQYIRDGKELPWENKQVFWTGQYHSEDKYLEIVETQVHYVPASDGRGITNGRIAYFRLTKH